MGYFDTRKPGKVCLGLKIFCPIGLRILVFNARFGVHDHSAIKMRHW